MPHYKTYKCDENIITKWKEQIKDKMEGPIHLVMSTGQVVGPNTTPELWFKGCLKNHVQFSRLKKNEVPYIMYHKDLEGA